MTTITEFLYSDHPNIKLIRDAFTLESSIPPIALTIPGMSGLKYRRFINNYMRLISDPRYLELGSFTGSTLCAAVGGIDNIKALAVDDFSYGGSSLAQCRANVDSVKGLNTDINVIDFKFENFDFSAHGKFNVYLYDAGHEEEEHFNAIVRAVPALDPVSLIIIDDWNDHGGEVSHVKTGTYNGFAKTNLEILYKVEIETGENPGFPSDWHNGSGIFLVRNNGV
jgi:hypothetical protein